ncbi:hypothetical protein WA026_012631 [Henosepilachna vigintioctopunctata]|uniref:Uncharacterized protein n=1 Tax=Henosepilachna vigintioctopunctata TaxID=420089 RepID=A0AAW1U8T9_9CUCU
MYIATLLLKESGTTSLSTLVDKALQKEPPFPEYELQLNVSQIVLIQRKGTNQFSKTSQPDEGFESDVDSLSIVSFDDSFTSVTSPEKCCKTPESDSANGSSSSDSDTDSPAVEQEQSFPKKGGVDITEESKTKKVELVKESYNLVSCLCYTDVKSSEILLFVIEEKTLVFKFDNVSNLQNFYTRFAALKAVNNQAIYNKNSLGRTFNLLQKTDNNGVTHIQITREPINLLYLDEGPSSIISINTPEDNLNQLINTSVQHIKSLNEYNRSNDTQIRQKFNHFYDHTENRKIIDKSASADDLLDLDVTNRVTDMKTTDFGLRKIWSSTENLLETLPKRPERKKKLKGKAPQPPDVEIKQDILSGQYVRVNVNKTEAPEPRVIIKGQLKESHPKKLQSSGVIPSKASLNTLVKNKACQILKYAPKKFETSTLMRNKIPTHEAWTNSIPRLFKTPRSRSETRIVQPMAYRYIDTNLNYPVNYAPLATANGRILKSHEAPYSFGSSQSYKTFGPSSNIGNRLFGLSPKLRDFNMHQDTVDGKWKISDSQKQNSDGNLKSVIKKDETRRKNEKKVTFSAYTTVQVV